MSFISFFIEEFWDIPYEKFLQYSIWVCFKNYREVFGRLLWCLLSCQKVAWKMLDFVRVLFACLFLYGTNMGLLNRMPCLPAWSTCLRAKSVPTSHFYVPTCQRRAKFSTSPAKRLTNFSNILQKNFSVFEFFNYA